VPKARHGLRIGDGALVDSMQHDGLWCAFDHCTMGASADIMNERLGITRHHQDEWSVASHARALAATRSGAQNGEIPPIPVAQRKGDPLVVDEDEGIRPGTTMESLAALRSAFSETGTTTAGNASQISDGAAAVLVADRAAPEAAGLPILAKILSYAQVAGPDAMLHERPAEALRVALKRASLTASQLDLVEINEAFASVGLWSSQLLEVDHASVNVNGGAVAIGHPLGATEARIADTLVNALVIRVP
jgi:acetyl-CoA C-acetyltransferase